jgi:hypothetical protein
MEIIAQNLIVATIGVMSFCFVIVWGLTKIITYFERKWFF